ncbi:MAG: ATP-binding protein [Bacteroidota bacterium]
MVAEWIVVVCTFGYLLTLFGLGWLGEQLRKRGVNLAQNPYVYALSLSVFCTAWTYYGSVGRAAVGGYDFLTIYLGPTLMAPLMWLIVRKMIRISKVEKISSLADLISSRYGKSITLGILVTVFSILGVLPYIALQLKSIGTSYQLLSGPSIFESLNQSSVILNDSLFYMTLGLGVFIIIFGTRTIETAGSHTGLLTVISFEAIIKLVVFIVIGVFVSYVIFDGVGDIFTRVQDNPELNSLLSFGANTGNDHWLMMIMLSMMAILFLPRQFQVAVVENTNEHHLKKAIWLFPLYLLVINLFVFPVAFGGRLTFFDTTVIGDSFMLALPLSFDQNGLALLGYIGGFSAATSMMIVSTFALSTMFTNNLLMPVLAQTSQFNSNHLSKVMIYGRRGAILVILFLAYLYNRYVVSDVPLVSIGLISFVAVAQFAPATLGALFWKGGTKSGAITGLVLGFGIWFFTLVVPNLVSTGFLPNSIVEDGLWGIALLKPHSFLGLESFQPITHGMFWSLFFNVGAYFLVSLFSTQSSKEWNQAELYVDIYKYSVDYEEKVAWKGKAYVNDIRQLLQRILGIDRTDELLKSFTARYGSSWEKQQTADSRLVNFAERVLAGAIGTGSARIMISNIVKEDEISLEEVYSILKESQQIMELNKELTLRSTQLRQAKEQLESANIKLQKLDAQKDDFISTVTHELKTPLTSIRAFSEILFDNNDLTTEERSEFLDTIVKETERMSRLINQVLDLEKLESGEQRIDMEAMSLASVIERAVTVTNLDERVLQLDLSENELTVLGDQDRLQQVLLNLISNAVKHTSQKGEISISAREVDGQWQVCVADNGRGIDRENQKRIFQRFFQARDQTLKKPPGTGLGLAITKRIVELHGGRIWVDSIPGKGSNFYFTLPIKFQLEQVEDEV